TGLVALACDKGPLTGIIFTRSNSGIASLAELKGESFAFSAPMSTVAKALLFDAGLTRKGFAALTNFSDQGSVTQAVESVVTGRKSSWRNTVAAVLKTNYAAGVTT